jgi:hypothetical protein
MSRLLRLENAPVRASATVQLLSRVHRPYLFRVRVKGEFPHTQVREYDLEAVNEAAAAFEGIKIFERQVSKAAAQREIILAHLPVRP